jgi:hypothetical protein
MERASFFCSSIIPVKLELDWRAIVAQLRRSRADDHLYILAGQSQGTWQLTDQGEQFLRSHGYHIPEYEESIEIDSGTYHLLRDKGFLYIHNISYDSHRFSPQFAQETAISSIGLPMYISLDDQDFSWNVAIDLGVLTEDTEVWNELKQQHPTFVTMNYSPHFLQRIQLLNSPCLLKVWPQALPYLVQWGHTQQARIVLDAAPKTPGLIAGWQGNVFLAVEQPEGMYRRRLPGSTISMPQSFYWLAKVDYKPDTSAWPGHALRYGKPNLSWQLWRMDLPEPTSVNFDNVERWFSYRQIKIAPLHYQLGLIGRFDAVSNDDWYSIQRNRPVLVRCDPSYRRGVKIAPQAQLSTEIERGNTRRIASSFQTCSKSLPVEQVSYFSWKAPGIGNYSMQVKGDASSEPFHLRVTESSVTLPIWLQGFSCTATSATASQTFHAFENTPYSLTDPKSLNVIPQHELASLVWTLEPVGLPVEVSWEYISTQGKQRLPGKAVQAGEALTAMWQEKIWPGIVDAQNVNVTFDAGSFGLIELTLSLVSDMKREKDIVWLEDERFISSLIWLSHAADGTNYLDKVALPGMLRPAINQMRKQASSDPVVLHALDRFLRAEVIPNWILFRLQALVAEIHSKESN